HRAPSANAKARARRDEPLVIRLLVASANLGKVREIESLLSGLPAWAVEAPPPDVPAPPETGATFLENARLKAEHYSRNAGGWAVADDSGLVVDALNGRPGLYSARYAASDRERNARLLKELEDVPEIDRTARFVCALALARDGVVVWT